MTKRKTMETVHAENRSKSPRLSLFIAYLW